MLSLNGNRLITRYLLTKHIFLGCCDEEIFGCRLRRRRQPDLLQREHGHALGRRQEDLRRTPFQAQGTLRTLKLFERSRPIFFFNLKSS